MMLAINLSPLVFSEQQQWRNGVEMGVVDLNGPLSIPVEASICMNVPHHEYHSEERRKHLVSDIPPFHL